MTTPITPALDAVRFWLPDEDAPEAHAALDQIEQHMAALEEEIWVKNQLIDNLEKTRNEAFSTIDRMNDEKKIPDFSSFRDGVLYGIRSTDQGQSISDARQLSEIVESASTKYFQEKHAEIIKEIQK